MMLRMLPTIHLILGLLLATLTLAFLMRIVLSWYPKINSFQGIWVILTWPTEPFLKVTRLVIPPIGGVDISPVIWVGLTSLLRELLVGPQGLLSQILTNSQNIT